MPEAQGWGRRLLRQRELPRQAGETARPPKADSQGAPGPRRGQEQREEDSEVEVCTALAGLVSSGCWHWCLKTASLCRMQTG